MVCGVYYIPTLLYDVNFNLGKYSIWHSLSNIKNSSSLGSSPMIFFNKSGKKDFQWGIIDQEVLLDHPLHFTVAENVNRLLDRHAKLLRDRACGGRQYLPLFVGSQPKRNTRLCMVDLLVLLSGKVRGIIEIEESGFLPTKICGKFLQAALATHFIHESQIEPVPFSDHVLFVQVLDGSDILKPGSQKNQQAVLIEQEIRRRLPLKESHISDYRLFYVRGPGDQDGLRQVSETVLQAIG